MTDTVAPLADAEVLAKGLQILQDGVKVWDDSTKQIEGICGDFEEKLCGLESDMLPMKEKSHNLAAARRNVCQSIEQMEEINEFFLLEEELRGVIAKGIRGGGLTAQAYTEEVKRVVEAKKYFWEWPSLRSQGDALKGLTELSEVAIKECVEEFTRTISSLGPSVQYKTRTCCYEPVDALAEAESDAMGSIFEAMNLLDKGGELRRSYQATRAQTVGSCMDTWSERYENNPAGQEGRGGGPWLRLYMDFCIKLCTGERLLWEKALRIEQSSVYERCRATEDAFIGVVMAPIEKAAQNVERAVLRIEAEVKDALEGRSVHRQGSDGDARVDAMVKLLEMVDVMERAVGLLVPILNLGPRKSKSSKVLGDAETNKAVLLVKEMQKRLRNACMQSSVGLVEAIRGDPSGKKSVPDNGSVHTLTSNTMRALKRILPFCDGYEMLVKTEAMPWDLIEEAATQSAGPVQQKGGARSGKDDGDLTKSYPKFTAFINHLLRSLVDNLVVKSRNYPSGKVGDAKRHIFMVNNAHYVFINARQPIAQTQSASPGTEAGTPTSILNRKSLKAEAILAIFKPLSPRNSLSPRQSSVKLPSPAANMSAKTKKPPTETDHTRELARGRFFSSGEDRGGNDQQASSVENFLTAQTLWLLKRVQNERLTAYSDLMFVPLKDACFDDTGLRGLQEGKLLGVEDGRKIKAKFSAFNEAWEEVHASQRSLNIGDSFIRDQLRREAKAKFLADYTAFFR
ncbi:unnamed protein product, partial [Chrysoparadoxa australica]